MVFDGDLASGKRLHFYILRTGKIHHAINV